MSVRSSPANLRLIIILKRVVENGSLEEPYNMKVSLLPCDMWRQWSRNRGRLSFRDKRKSTSFFGQSSFRQGIHCSIYWW